MNRSEFKQAKGEDTLVSDADLQGLKPEPIERVVQEEESYEDDTDESGELETEESDEETEATEQDDLPQLTEREQTAFEKRLEREKTKLQEKIRAETEETYKTKYAKHDQLIEQMGAKDVDTLLEYTREQRLVAETQRLATQHDWTEEEATGWYNEQKRKQQDEAKDKLIRTLTTQSDINKLRSKPEYAGIETMEKDILDTIDKTNGALTAEQAYWALGGSKRAEQIKLESSMRNQANRSKTPRTVLTDNQTSSTTERPLSPEIIKQMKEMDITPAEARALMKGDSVNTLGDYREQRKKAKGG